MTKEDLFRMLAKDGGKILSSANCSVLEIAEARACNRMYVDDEGFGYIWFPTAETLVVTGIVKIHQTEFQPYFWIGNQGFDLRTDSEIEDAEHSIKMLEIALKNLYPNNAKFVRNKSNHHYWGIQSEIEK